MAWGCQCGDGWFTLLNTLCERLQWWCDVYDWPQVELRQVKEKFGELRVHLQGASPEQRGMVEMARALSARVCDTCGQWRPLTNGVDAHFCLPGKAPQ